MCQTSCAWVANNGADPAVAAAVPAAAAADCGIVSADTSFAADPSPDGGNANPTYDAGCAFASWPGNTRPISRADETRSVERGFAPPLCGGRAVVETGTTVHIEEWNSDESSGQGSDGRDHPMILDNRHLRHLELTR